MQPYIDQVTDVLSPLLASVLEAGSHLNFFILLPIFGAVGMLLWGYFKNYQRPANYLNAQLGLVADRVRAARLRHPGAPEALQAELDGVFAMSPFASLWEEYTSTLHIVHGRGEGRTVLATVPAEAFFSKESIIDLQINADFYRHLPGILTGIGIIGTFSGLVWGLHRFRPETSEAVYSLSPLLQEVTSAFLGSGIAILAAIIVTYKEKSALSRCYRAVDALTHEIDSLYAGGAGEEYLARLVSATEANILAQDKLADQIASGIREALAQPMAELAGVVERVTARQDEAVGAILDEVLKTFAGRLEDTFGAQIERVNSSFDKASEAMERVQQSMIVLLGDIASVGPGAADAMAGTLENAIENASIAQDSLALEMREFIAEMREDLTRHQTHSAEAMELTMRSVLLRLQEGLGRLAAERGDLVEQEKTRHAELTSGIIRLVESLDSASIRTAENVAALQSTATGAISGMNNGAVVMRMAADRFTVAGNTLSEALERAESLSHVAERLEGLLVSAAQLRRAI